MGGEQTTSLSREAHYTRDLEKAAGCAVGPILRNVAEERPLNITQFEKIIMVGLDKPNYKQNKTDVSDIDCYIIIIPVTTM